jgi:RNA-binding protein NOB1
VVAEALKGLKIESSDGNETDVEEKSESASGVIVASSEDAKIEPIDSQSNVLEALAQESSPTSEGVSDQVSFQTKPADVPLYDDPSDEDDGEGEWITPSNVALHKSRALDLLPASGSGKEKTSPVKPILAGCMTADFAMQNVLLQMNLSLVNTEGKRIERVKTWVLRCHACFKYAL